MTHSKLRDSGVRRAGLLFVALAVAAALPERASAQCTLGPGAPLSFEPSPPGAPRPSGLNGGYNNAFQMFRSGGQARILMKESFGYSVLDIQSNPMSPYALVYDDLRFEGVVAHGDGQTYIASLGVSDDGQRAAFSINGPGTPPWGTVVGQPSGNGFAPLGGDFSMPGATQGMVIQHLGSRYVAYALAGSVLAVADVTTLSDLTAGNIPAERVSAVPGGGALYLAGNKVVVTNTGSGTIILDASNPGPVGAIASGFTQVLVTPADWGMASDADAVVAAADPANSAKTWLLGEFATSPPTYKLMSVQGTTKSLNPRAYQIPVGAGETWNATYTMPGLVGSANGLVALMWARRSSPTAATQLHSAPVSSWSSSTFGVIDLTSSGITPAAIKGQAGSGNSVYTYVATGSRAYAIPLTCIAGNAPATSSLQVSAYGSTLVDGATVFLGDTVTIAPTVVPSPSATPLSGFGWNFDFDFHAGNAADDRGTSPRILNPDNGQLGNTQNPPASVTLVGPCDPTAGGVPASGVGCWNAVKNNAATGGPDFTGSEAVGTTKALRLALEANNAYGTSGVGTFTLNWKVPAIRLAATQVLTGNPVVGAADGHPLPSGFKWYFGSNSTAPAGETLNLDAGCTGASCNHAFSSKGRFNVWFSAPYANDYATPDYALGTTVPMVVTVSDFVPAFLVNGASATPVTALANSQITITNESTHGSVTNISYLYCISAVGASCTPSTSLPIADQIGGTATIPASAVCSPPLPCSGWLHVRAAYVNGIASIADWTPSFSGVSDPTAFPITVTNVVPTIKVYVNGVDVCAGGAGPGGGGCVTGSIDVFTGDNLTAYSYVGTQRDTVTAISWSFPGASPSAGSGQGAAFSYSTTGTYTITLNGYGSPVTYNINVSVRAVSLSVSVSVSPNPMAVNSASTFACYASGGTGSYSSYAWNFGDGQSGSGQSTTHSYGTANNYQASCTATDTAGATGSGFANISVTSGGGGGGSCSGLYAWLTNASGGVQYDNPPGTGFSVAPGEQWTFRAPGGFTGYSWQFGDGQTSTLQYATHAYASPLTTTVTLSASGCSTLSYPLTVTGAGGGGPSANACTGLAFDIKLNGVSTYVSSQVGSGYAANLGDDLTFVVTPTYTVPSGATVTWDFGDNLLPASGTPATHRYVAPGSYTVTVTITNTGGAPATCTQSQTITISGPSAAFTVRYQDNSLFLPTKVEGGKMVAFTASDAPASVDSYDWDFGDGTAHASGQTATHAYNPGTYSAKLTITKGSIPVFTTTPLTVVAPPEPPKWVAAGMAYVLGQVPGTIWQSDVTILNPDPARTATYSIAFLDARHPVDDASKLTWLGPIQVPALGSVASANVLGQIFGQSLGSYGALMVRGDVAPSAPVITARTFNAGDATKGTFGLSVPSAPVTGGVSAQAPPAASVLIGLRHNDSDYTNLGLVNLRNDWPKVGLDFADAVSGAALGTLTVDLMPYQSLQINKALEAAAGVGATSDLYTVRVRILQGTAVYPYSTVIDRKSADPIVVTPADSPASTYRIPGIVRLTGANGELWRSRFTLGNPSLSGRSVHLKYSYIPCDAGGCRSRVTVEGDVGLGAGTSASVEDFVSFWLPTFAGIPVSDTTSYQGSYLDVAPASGDPNQDPLLVLGETYNDTPNGHVGLQIPGFTPADGASRTGANKRLVLAGLASTAGFRTNLALVFVGGTPGRWCSVHVYSPQGTKLKDIPVSVDGVVQVGDATLFGGIPGDRSRLSVVIDNLDDGITIAGYATIIDNLSGGPTFVKAQPVP